MFKPFLGPSFQRKTWAYLLVALAFWALSLLSQAQLPSPAPDGGYLGQNTAEGDGALSSVQIDTDNGNGTDNTALGYAALQSNTTGNFNTATGYQALYNNQTSQFNTAVGSQALYSQATQPTIGDPFLLVLGSTAIGYQALFSADQSSGNTAVGVQTLFANTLGFNNTATGWRALTSNTTGSADTATGFEALYSNTGTGNTANGSQALVSNTTGNYNTAIGISVLIDNATGSYNTAVGAYAFLNANSTGSNNIAVGASAGESVSSGSNNILIGNVGADGESNTIRIGTPVTRTAPDTHMLPAHTATFISGITGVTVSSPLPVVIDPNGQLGTASADSLRGPPGDGLVSGSLLFLVEGTSPPSGYTFLATTTIPTGSGKKRGKLTVNIYQKN